MVNMPERDDTCFLCKPDPNLLYLSDQSFQAMLGIGPIVEGYTVLSTNAHIRSMFDLPSDHVEAFLTFRFKVVELLTRLYGPVIITEHGRVPNCDFNEPTQEPHCYHAHQLIFPVCTDLVPELRSAFHDNISQYADFAEAHKQCDATDEYAYYEDSSGIAYVAKHAKFPRQFFRMLVADKVGHIERVDWRNWQGWDLVNTAKLKLQKADDGSGH